jgi:hypothetical protein
LTQIPSKSKQEEKMAEPKANDDESTVQALDDVLFRFATAEDEKFAAAVSRVLPKVLGMLEKKSDKVPFLAYMPAIFWLCLADKSRRALFLGAR